MATKITTKQIINTVIIISKSMSSGSALSKSQPVSVCA
jgi:hypothetical protein